MDDSCVPVLQDHARSFCSHLFISSKKLSSQSSPNLEFVKLRKKPVKTLQLRFFVPSLAGFLVPSFISLKAVPKNYGSTPSHFVGGQRGLEGSQWWLGCRHQNGTFEQIVFFQGVFLGYGNMDLLRNNMEDDWSRACWGSFRCRALFFTCFPSGVQWGSERCRTRWTVSGPIGSIHCDIFHWYSFATRSSSVFSINIYIWLLLY